MNDVEWDMLQSLANQESLPMAEYVRFVVRKLYMSGSTKDKEY
jgi:hypothetical protein